MGCNSDSLAKYSKRKSELEQLRASCTAEVERLGVEYAALAGGDRSLWPSGYRDKVVNPKYEELHAAKRRLRNIDEEITALEHAIEAIDRCVKNENGSPSRRI